MIVSISPEQSLEADSALLAAVADPTRLSILRQLATGEPTCVCELHVDPTIPPNLLSYHLKVLREARLVETTRRGRRIDYALATGALDRLHSALPNPGGAS